MAHKSHSEKIEPLSVRELYEKNQKEWSLEILAGEEGMDSSVIHTTELNRPGLALAGYYEVFSAERVQLIGLTESSFLKGLAIEDRKKCIERTLAFNLPCVIITSALDACQELYDVCRERSIPLFRTTHITSPFQTDLGHYLERRLASTWTIHGVMVDVFGMGVLIQGKSGVGKSECALDLVERGHRLIADDVVIIRRVGKDVLIAEPSPTIGYHMELRGIGIIDVELLFGVRGVREEAEIRLMVTLEKWDPAKEYERLGLTDHNATLFDVELPEYTLPLEPGRNIAKLVEVAALNQRLEDQGINVAQELDQRIRDMMMKKTTGKRVFTAIDRLRKH